MPKRTATRSNSQQQRNRNQRYVKHVYGAPEAQALETPESSAVEDEKITNVATATQEEKITEEAPKANSASSRMAARRQANQRTQQRNATTLITAEHFSYVKRDLITIAVLATVMVAAIIVLYFVLGAKA